MSQSPIKARTVQPMKRSALCLLLGILSAFGVTNVHALYFTFTVPWDRTIPVCVYPVVTLKS